MSLHYFWEIRQMIKNNTWKKVLQFNLIGFVQNKQKYKKWNGFHIKLLTKTRARYILITIKDERTSR